MKTLRACFLVATAAAVAVSPAVAQVDGDLDPSFHGNGKFVMDPLGGGFDQEIRAVLRAPDGRLAIAGTRETEDGTETIFWSALDGSTAPTLCTFFAPDDLPSAAEVNAIAFDHSGRLLIAGSGDYGAGTGRQGIVFRVLYPGCSLDEDFGAASVFHTENAFESEFIDVAVDSLLRVVLAGKQSFVVRLDDDGLPDLGFAGDGQRELTDLGDVSALALQPDDRIVVAQGASGTFNLRRINGSGGDDSTFSGDGLFTYSTGSGGSGPTDVLVEPETGKIVVVGQEGTFFATVAVRVTPEGSLDPTFSGDGLWFGNAVLAPSAITIQSDSQLLLSGSLGIGPSHPDFGAQRLSPQGVLDLTLGENGILAIPFDLGGGLQDFARAATLHGGNLAIAGRVDTSGGPDTGAVARIWMSLIFTDGFERGTPTAWSRTHP